MRSSPHKSEVNAIAARVADAIEHSKDKTVVVFDFAGPDRRLGVLGAALADQFSAALAASSTKLHVEDRSRLRKLIGENSLESENILDQILRLGLQQTWARKL